MHSYVAHVIFADPELCWLKTLDLSPFNLGLTSRWKPWINEAVACAYVEGVSKNTGWLQIFCIFTPTWGNDQILLMITNVFQMGGSTTNYIEYHGASWSSSWKFWELLATMMRYFREPGMSLCWNMANFLLFLLMTCLTISRTHTWNLKNRDVFV